MDRIFVAHTGASGAVYGVTLVRTLAAAGIEVLWTVTESGAKVIAHELAIEVNRAKPDLERLFPGHEGRVRYFPVEAVEAPVSSGTYRVDAGVICPCSMDAVASIAAGLAGNLVGRAAAVMLKEGRPLVLVPRETPLSLIHLRAMTAAAEAGAVVLPASPGFYHHPRTIDDLVRHVVAKIGDRLNLRLPLIERWGGGG